MMNAFVIGFSIGIFMIIYMIYKLKKFKLTL